MAAQQDRVLCPSKGSVYQRILCHRPPDKHCPSILVTTRRTWVTDARLSHRASRTSEMVMTGCLFPRPGDRRELEAVGRGEGED